MNKQQNAENAQKFRQKRFDKGLCVQCGKLPHLPGITQCQNCNDRTREKTLLRKKERKHKGLCPLCGKQSPAPNRAHCQECADEDKLTKRARDTERLKVGICTVCGKRQCVPGKSKCNKCATVANTARDDLRKINLASGLCSECGSRPSLPKKYRCKECTDAMRLKDAERRRRKIADGICGINGCNESIFRSVFCKAHWEHNRSCQKERAAHLRSKNLCTSCGKNPTNDCTLCESCHLKRAAKKYLGDKSHWVSLQDKFNSQQRRCVYSGIPLLIGQNASLDHIIAKSKGGTNTIGNLQWVHIWINKMKNDLPHEEFLLLLDDFADRLALFRNANKKSTHLLAV
jgi:hypothetical protein